MLFTKLEVRVGRNCARALERARAQFFPIRTDAAGK